MPNAHGVAEPPYASRSLDTYGPQNFFASFSNVLDLIGFVTCILSIYILSLGCTEAEKVSDMLLMFVRIGIQGTRLVLILRK